MKKIRVRQLGLFFPVYAKHKKCSKPPISYGLFNQPFLIPSHPRHAAGLTRLGPVIPGSKKKGRPDPIKMLNPRFLAKINMRTSDVELVSVLIYLIFDLVLPLKTRKSKKNYSWLIQFRTTMGVSLRGSSSHCWVVSIASHGHP